MLCQYLPTVMQIFSRLVRTLLAWTVGSFRATSRSLSAAISLGAVLIGPGVALQVGSPFPTLPIHTKKTPANNFQDISVSFEVAFKAATHPVFLVPA